MEEKWKEILEKLNEMKNKFDLWDGEENGI